MKIDESEDWMDTSFKSQKKSEKSNEERKPERGRRVEQPKQPKNNEKKQQEKGDQRNSLDTSNWLQSDELQDEKNQSQNKSSRGAQCKNDLSILMAQQLVPDKPIDSSWGDFQSENNNEGNRRGNRQGRQDDRSEEGTRRGNRENGNFTKKKPYVAEQFEQRPRGGNYRNNNNYGYRDEESRGGGRGRGRGGYRSNYQGREGQQDRDYRNDDRGSNNYYKKRDNQLSTNEKEEMNQEQQGPKRGNRGNRQDNSSYQGNRQDYNSNRGYNNYNRNYNNRDYNNNREYNNDNRGQYNNNRGNNYNNNRQYNNRGNYNRDQDNNRDNYNTRRNGYQQKILETSYSAKSQTKSVNSSVVSIEKSRQDLMPKGRRCWPESTIYILGCKFCITYRNITEFKCKLLVIPYASTKMQYYPGNIINSSQVDYKQRIINKGDLISKAGSIYLQKAISVGTFVALAFLKIDEKRISDSLKLGIKTLLSQIQNVEGPSLQSVIFPICKQLGNTEVIIQSFLEHLQSCKKVKQVYVTTNQPQQFVKSMNLFVEKVQEMLNENQILIV